MLVLCLHRVPAFVILLHCTVADSPLACFFSENPNLSELGGLQILQGVNPSSDAFFNVSSCETFFTIRQEAR